MHRYIDLNNRLYNGAFKVTKQKQKDFQFVKLKVPLCLVDFR